MLSTCNGLPACTLMNRLKYGIMYMRIAYREGAWVMPHGQVALVLTRIGSIALFRLSR